MRRVHLYLLLWLIPIVGLVLIGRAFILKVTPLTSGQPTKGYISPDLRGPLRLGQTVDSEYAGLSGISVMFTNFGRRNTEDVIFHLTTWPDTGKEVATGSVNAGELKDHDYYRFTFPAIPDSQGKSYYFYVESPTSKPDNTAAVITSIANVYQGGATYEGDRALERDMTFIAYYNPNPLQVADVFVHRMAAKKPGIWGQPAFYIVLFSLYLILALAFFWMVLRMAMAGAGESENPDGPFSR